ncbi:pyruvate:ferredoxin (flavodoxin) oxidoreductase [Aeoliella sp. ICT_H6.2]|uniref:Pyruvate:ferredoxin (Flavodoxin) oxidoreductase n=1 Tax=Aeoliella straminimaris TaxID=2954799 RepID=A0A9X2F7Y3_9BACT|nr:pyruvate:ferredoxin (flavodoxin) oxidoreductase [Aeoliella straminimaris]
MSATKFVTVDGNEAAAHVAHLTNEVIAIYPITPASPMGEFSDAWSARGRENIFGTVPDVIEMQSEGGAAAAVHGALQAGALSTTFTASQGLLLMIPTMYKVAGEMTPTVFHIAARSLATHALSIFGDHADVMAVRQTGWALLASNSVQEVHDMAMIAQAATLKSRIPFLHFFDGFRTSHEVNKISQLPNEVVCEMTDLDLIQAHRDRAMNPDKPILRGSAQNPDVYFQAREAVNPYYSAVPGIVSEAMQKFAELTGRTYQLYDYAGAEDAERVIVMMGSGVGATEEAVSKLNNAGEKVGVLKVRLYRPFDVPSFLAALPASAKAIAVLDRTKEPGSIGEPLYQDVITALSEGGRLQDVPTLIGGRYGLSSKEYTPAMAASVFEELKAAEPKKHFTVGIIDDVTNLSLKWDPEFSTEPDDVMRAVFYGLGSDGTVGASKNSVKIIGENTDKFAQGYFVYDSKKAGSVTVSHLRFSPRPIESSYLIDRANFVACHQFNFLARMDVLKVAVPGATFLLNSPYGPDEIWDKLPQEAQQQIIDKGLKFYVVDAYKVAREAEMGSRINTIMQTCFFSLAKLLPGNEAIDHIKAAIQKTYGKRGQSVVDRNNAAVDGALSALCEVTVPSQATSTSHREALVASGGSDFVQRVTSMLIAGLGDLLPVSALPVDGTFPTDTARFEKRSIAQQIPIWDPDICIQCGLCALVCPHAAIRTKAYPASSCNGSAPADFLSRPWKGKELPDHLVTIQVAPDDCTGCGVCVDVCPAKSKEVVKHKAINMEEKDPHLERERANFDYFLGLPEVDRTAAKIDTVKGSQLLQPLFEFSGACSGCGETPYLKLMTQLFGDRVLIGNATGCSSIYGGNLPTTPYSQTSAGRGPTWNNSLFEDTAEFGLGLRLAVDQKRDYAEHLLKKLASTVGDDLVGEIVNATCADEAAIAEQRERVEQLRLRLKESSDPDAMKLASIADVLVKRSVWIVGGDGWAYDIGFGGLDHVLTTGRDVNILVLDTGVYSNTGGQMSKATPRAAVAKFAAGGKPARKKDLGMLAVSYGNVYVAQIAMGSNPNQTLKAFRQAESYPGVSLILAYSHCIAHGINMETSMSHQKDVVQTGFWPLFRYDPREAHAGTQPFHLDSRKPTKPFKELAMSEARFAMLARTNPEHAEYLFNLAQGDIDDRWHYYEQMAGVEREVMDEIVEVEVEA